MTGTAKVEKRNRPPKSCEPCRTRKLKCDRSLPCDSCIRRNKQSICHYASNADRNERRVDKGSSSSVAERLKHLEGLLTIVAQQRDPMASLSITEDISAGGDGKASIVTPASIESRGAAEAKDGDSVVPPGLAGHVDSSHWSSILENIKAIREELPNESPPDKEQALLNNSPGDGSEAPLGRMSPDLDFGSSKGVSHDSILAALPPRQVCDILISMFFRWHYTMMPILHPVKFQREYEAFWKAPRRTSNTWIALLFALLSLSTGVYEASGMVLPSPVPIPPSKDLSTKTQHCLLTSNYILCNEHAVEAFLLHLVGCWLRSKASDTNLWFLMGKLVQLAISKGYHRDCSKLPNSNISAFDGEMRRRIWVCIYQLDSLMSFQLGLPSMVPSDSCDTELPRNLDQNQLHPDITELPPSRPLSENTTILYSIVKASVMAKFKEVVKHTRSTTPPTHETTLILDTEVRQAYVNIPDHFKYKPLTNFLTEEVSVILTRTTLELLHLKSIIVLHRQHLMYRNDSRSEFSRNACLEAARRLLERQAEMDRATKTGGQLHDMKWMITTLTLSDFTLAAMVICLDLTITIRLGADSPPSPTAYQEVQRDLKIIQNAHKIWIVAGELCSEARTVAHALGSTVERVNDFLSAWSLPADSESWQTLDVESSSSLTNDSLYQINDLDMMDIIDWTFIDNQFQDPNINEIDLDMWLMETAGPL
ncbi:fungal-specific transcription factor domain-containing protein [Fusarium venenatum]|uniref:fungal-specific transcription factor domain-containing protein n=1 Tax=Fusarium venenatum TaxID=56646 RepID=UPI001D25EAEE|nr:fungal-specific transcription factor domain-containing protein [Fusarium venenatum]